ncbi:hypothetical protein J6590_050433 [Homalodisca vitripennis]|nr:hypothetical protein J6590_050433 [Homalodisca vitripennis]
MVRAREKGVDTGMMPLTVVVFTGHINRMALLRRCILLKNSHRGSVGRVVRDMFLAHKKNEMHLTLSYILDFLLFFLPHHHPSLRGRRPISRGAAFHTDPFYSSSFSPSFPSFSSYHVSSPPDTLCAWDHHILLNVFLAIAVDNLADAESLTAIEKEADEEAEKQAEMDQMGEGGENTSQLEGEEHMDDDQRDYDGNIDEENEEMSVKDEDTRSHTKVCLEVGDSEDYYEEQNDNQVVTGEPGESKNGEDNQRKRSALPRRVSDTSQKTEKKPLPEGSSFFVFSHTNR